MGRRTTTTFGPDQAAFISFIGIFFPPVAVAIVTGCHKDVGINACLWILGGLPGIIHAFWVVAKHTRPTPLPADIESALYITSPAGSEVDLPISHHARTARGSGRGSGHGHGRETSIQVPAPVHSTNSPRMYEYNLPSGAGSPRAQAAVQGPRSGEITPTLGTMRTEGPFADPAHTAHGAGAGPGPGAGAGVVPPAQSAPAYQVLAEWKAEGKTGDA